MSDKVIIGINGDAYEELVDELKAISKREFNLSNHKDRRDRAARIVNAFDIFIMKDGLDLPRELNTMIVDSFYELTIALGDLDLGRTPALFNREIKTPNNNTKIIDGIAIDLIIVCRKYLINYKKLPQGVAESKIREILNEGGIDWSDEHINNIVRTHNRKQARNSKRPDLRSRKIDNDHEFDKHMLQVIKYLKSSAESK